MATDLTVQQYEEAIGSLTKKEIEFLQKLYEVEPASDQYEIGERLGYKGPAKLIISKIGKKISEFLNIPPDLTGYNDNITDRGWFIFIHRQYFKEQNSIADIYDYWDMQPNLRTALENLKLVELYKNENIEVLDTEIDQNNKQLYPEGTLISVLVNKFERDKEAIRDAKRFHGEICKGCNIDFKKTYGEDIKNIIEIHHKYPMSSGKRNTNPETDLVPLCPNCHAVVHSQKELMTIEELQMRIKSTRGI